MEPALAVRVPGDVERLEPTAVQLEAERALVAALGGGCQLPIGAIAVPADAGALELRAIVTSLDGARVIRYKKVGDQNDAAGLGRAVAEALLEEGAGDILNASRADAEPRQLT